MNSADPEGRGNSQRNEFNDSMLLVSTGIHCVGRSHEDLLFVYQYQTMKMQLWRPTAPPARSRMGGPTKTGRHRPKASDDESLAVPANKTRGGTGQGGGGAKGQHSGESEEAEEGGIQ